MPTTVENAIGRDTIGKHPRPGACWNAAAFGQRFADFWLAHTEFLGAQQ